MRLNGSSHRKHVTVAANGKSDVGCRTDRVYVTNDGDMVVRSNFEFVRYRDGWIDVDD